MQLTLFYLIFLLYITSADDALFSNRLVKRMIMITVFEFFVQSSLRNANELSICPSVCLKHLETLIQDSGWIESLKEHN